MLFDSGCVVCTHALGPVCGACEARLTAAPAVTLAGLDQCRIAFSLDDVSRPIIAALKYRRQRRIARWLAQRVDHLVPRAADLITWIPATPERRKSRGFDQAEELATALSRLTGVPAAGLLHRRSDDQRQTGRSRSARLAGPDLVALRTAPRFVVLVDDVITTGSSLRSAALAMRSATPAPDRLVGVAVAATPSRQDRHLPDLTNASSIRQWT